MVSRISMSIDVATHISMSAICKALNLSSDNLATRDNSQVVILQSDLQVEPEVIF